MKDWTKMCENERGYTTLFNSMRSGSGRYIFDEVMMPEDCGRRVCTVEFRYFGGDRIALICVDAPVEYTGSDEQIRRWLESGEATFSSFDELGRFLARFKGSAPAEPQAAPAAPRDTVRTPAPERPEMQYDRDGVTLPENSSRLLRLDRDKIFIHVSENIFGQELVLRKMIYLVTNYLCTKNKTRPLTVFLYGDPGTGKSESVKYLVDAINKQLKDSQKLYYRPYDCTQLQTKGDITRLIGAAPSYVGFDEPGVFSVLEEHPNTVFVFEEVEKAAANCTEVIMQAMETGKLETNGKTLKNGESFYDLSGCVIFFTSNVEIDKPKSLGFGQAAGSEEKLSEAASDLPLSKAIGLETAEAKKKLYESKAFRREVISRMTAIIKFSSLKGEAVKDIAAKCIRETAEKRHLLLITKLGTDLFQQFLNEAADDINSFGVRTLRSAAEFYFDDAFREYAANNPDYSHIEVSGTLDNIVITPSLQ